MNEIDEKFAFTISLSTIIDTTHFAVTPQRRNHSMYFKVFNLDTFTSTFLER